MQHFIICNMKTTTPFLLHFTICIILCISSIDSFCQNLNGQFDDITELSTKYTIPFVMPDGVKLMTDIFLPIPQDCLITTITIPDFGSGEFTKDLILISKGKQLVIYDSINGGLNPNPYKLPIIFVRTPYNKEGADAAGVVSLFGYAFSYQDQRGRYSSEGVYMPLYSDGWSKEPYHSNVKHVLDLTDLSDPLNGNKHEDGYNSIKYLLDSVKREYDLNNDGTVDTVDNMTYDIIGLFGASALGYNQFQAVAAHKPDSLRGAVKSITPIVAPAEFFKSTGFQNGILRDRLVTGWIKGQIFTGIDDDSISFDNDIQNALHTSFDYGLPNKFDAANKAIDHFVSVRYEKDNGSLDVAGYYPNSRGRADMDVSRAPVDINGEGAANGAYSRYTNMEVPAYNITGWWDIFIDGQIESWAYMRKYLNDSLGNRDLQKIVIGPWAHQTIASRTTGDMTYPSNVMDIIGNIEFSEDSVPLSDILKSEILSWFRYTLNNVPNLDLGRPKFILHESQDWQSLSTSTFVDLDIRIPASNYLISFEKMLDFMNGVGPLENLTYEIRITPITGGETYIPGTLTIPALGTPLIDGLDGQAIQPIPNLDFKNDIPNVRFYVVGPNNDGIAENDSVGNYWFSADTFPLINNIAWTKKYLHQNGTLNKTVPSSDEGFKIYVHDPDDPIRSIGGANMIVKDPQGDRDSQGQMDLTNPFYAPHSLNRPGVISFTGETIQDSLCVIGFPVATLYAKTSPGGVTSGPTDTDFFVRILDVYPDGKEYFVVEGCVNARARDYARALVKGRDGTHNYRNKSFPSDEPKDSIDHVPFSNIEIGQIYEYQFKMLPIAYTWGKGHKMKVLISSSNYNRYQVNPNLPIEDGEFFRRKPGDGQQYTYNGISMAPRVAVQRIAFSQDYPSNIDLPIYDTSVVTSTEEVIQWASRIEAIVFPNPANEQVSIYMTKVGKYHLKMTNITGQIIYEGTFTEQITLPVSDLSSGLYFFKIRDSKSKELIVKRISIL
ncbi:MAG TPA: CocE/NonD family hydrolase [Flavobacteriales bacterium]|nr:CocE/NonD family hydrolase [Flavobacteriales bacterium]